MQTTTVKTTARSRLERLVSRWRVIPQIRYVNYHRAYPNTKGTNCWKRWFSVERYWHGRIININVRHHSLILDFNRNWLADMIDGG